MKTTRSFREATSVLILAGSMAIAPATALAADHTPSAGVQTGTGATELKMITKVDKNQEYGGTTAPKVIDAPEDTPKENLVDDDGYPDPNGDKILNPAYNPDGDSDGYGDNLAFSVPAAINYVVDAKGSLTGPSNAQIENHSPFGIHVSSMKATAEDGFTFVADAATADGNNAVQLAIGPSADKLNVADYTAAKAYVTDASKWNMEAGSITDGTALTLTTDGTVKNLTTDVTESTKFGTINWYVKAGTAAATPAGDESGN